MLFDFIGAFFIVELRGLFWISFSFFAFSFSAFYQPSPTIQLSSSWVTVGLATIAHFYLPKLFRVSLILSTHCYSSTCFSLKDCYHLGSNCFDYDEGRSTNEVVDLLLIILEGCFSDDCCETNDLIISSFFFGSNFSLELLTRVFLDLLSFLAGDIFSGL